MLVTTFAKRELSARDVAALARVRREIAELDALFRRPLNETAAKALSRSLRYFPQIKNILNVSGERKLAAARRQRERVRCRA